MKKYNHISNKIDEDGVFYQKSWLNDDIVRKLNGLIKVIKFFIFLK
tara:strand:+ start:102 stop:239 length:138 start_codon:yes stop_codon:yes gene_type:complete